MRRTHIAKVQEGQERNWKESKGKWIVAQLPLSLCSFVRSFSFEYGWIPVFVNNNSHSFSPHVVTDFVPKFSFSFEPYVFVWILNQNQTQKYIRGDCPLEMMRLAPLQVLTDFYLRETPFIGGLTPCIADYSVALPLLCPAGLLWWWESETIIALEQIIPPMYFLFLIRNDNEFLELQISVCLIFRNIISEPCTKFTMFQTDNWQQIFAPLSLFAVFLSILMELWREFCIQISPSARIFFKLWNHLPAFVPPFFPGYILCFQQRFVTAPLLHSFFFKRQSAQN